MTDGLLSKNARGKDEAYEEGQAGEAYIPGLYRVSEHGLREILDSAVMRGIRLKPDNQDAYMWAHDKLQQVSYSLIPDELKSGLHSTLGRLIWRMRSKCHDQEWMIFMAADQLNRFSDCQHGKVLGAEVASLCLEAAKLSLSKSALFPAFDMMMAGMNHLAVEGRWTTHYDLTLELTSAVGELSLQLGKYDEAMFYVTEIQACAKTLEDKFKANRVMLKMITSGKDRNYQIGVEKCIEILKEYGVRFPGKFLAPGQLFVENQKLRRKLPGGNLSALLSLPKMSDTKSSHILKLLVEHLSLYLFFVNGDNTLITYAIVRALNLSIDDGLAEDTALAIA